MEAIHKYLYKILQTLVLLQKLKQSSEGKGSERKGNEGVVGMHLKDSVHHCHIFPVLEKMMIPICASQSTESSFVFLMRPPLLLEKVTCLVVVFSILFISIFPRPMSQFPSTLSFSLNPYTHYHTKIQVKENLYIYVHVNQPFEFFYLLISTENKQRF